MARPDVALCFLIVGVASWAPAAADIRAAALRDLLSSTPADSLIEPLRRFETEHAMPTESSEAAFLLGKLHFARGEYREAAEAFGRAAARLEPRRKPEVRYWVGLSWLGLGDHAQARAALEEVVRSGSTRRADALLGVAQALELARRPQQALEPLLELTELPASETTPAALERLAVVAEALGYAERSRHARGRLWREYPRSFEAASARLAAASEATEGGAVSVTIGAFIDPARARSLASSAKRSGFPQAEVVTRGSGLTAVHVVRLGSYPSRAEAIRAGEQATSALGVAYQVGTGR